jgi:hypothetical protein
MLLILFTGIFFHSVLLRPPFLVCCEGIASSVWVEKVCYLVSALLLATVRSNRIHRIFYQPPTRVSNPPHFIGALSQVIITSFLICIQVLIAVVWLAVEPPSVETVQVNSRTVDLRCGESPYSLWPKPLPSDPQHLLCFSDQEQLQRGQVYQHHSVFTVHHLAWVSPSVFCICSVWERMRELFPPSCYNPECVHYTPVPLDAKDFHYTSKQESKEIVTSNFSTVQVTER